MLHTSARIRITETYGDRWLQKKTNETDAKIDQYLPIRSRIIFSGSEA